MCVAVENWARCSPLSRGDRAVPSCCGALDVISHLSPSRCAASIESPWERERTYYERIGLPRSRVLNLTSDRRSGRCRSCVPAAALWLCPCTSLIAATVTALTFVNLCKGKLKERGAGRVAR